METAPEAALSALHQSSAFSQSIPTAADGFNHSIAARGLEGRSQALDMHVDSPLFDEHMIAPHLIQQLRAAVHALRMRHEEMQQAEFGRTEIELDIVAGVMRRHAVRCRIKAQAIDRDQ